MANFVFNSALGRVVEKVADGAVLRILMLKASDTDASLRDLEFVSEVLALGGTTEADFTNYARQTLANVLVNVNDANDRAEVDCDDVVFAAAGGASNNTLVAAIIYEFGTNDADSPVLAKYDLSYTTDGNNFTLVIDNTGFFNATSSS